LENENPKQLNKMKNSVSTHLKSTSTEICYLGLGSNLNNPINQINEAINFLANSTIINLLTISPLYKSAPMGPQNQDDYINAVVKLETSLKPIALLDYLQSIENSYGRIRNKEQWSPRTLDLDLLLYGEQQIESKRLTVPHYGMKERAFVLFPLYDIAKDLIFPDNLPIKKFVEIIKKTKPRIFKLAKEMKVHE
jgi:2-amino-4-hydroxy-6-hydroxymethyldihydropteridine diphosphokinase